MIKNVKSIKKYRIISVVFIITVLVFLIYKTSAFYKLYDDILFFKFIEIEENTKQKEIKKENETIEYIFDVSCKKTNEKNIFLFDTLKKETLIENMLAPGIEGEFNIILMTNLDTKYQIKFSSKSIKPQNLKFKNLETEEMVNNIQDLDLEGTLKKNTTKIIPIKWSWSYENTKEGDLQDTIDGKKIKNYEFSINATGEKWR